MLGAISPQMRQRIIAARRARQRVVAKPTPQVSTPQTPEQKALARKAAWEKEWAYGVEPGRNLGNMPLTPLGKELRTVILARDWDTLFTKMIPLYWPDGDKTKPARGAGWWQKNWALSKYSFKGDGANKIYVPWTQADIRSFVFSPYYTVAPDYVCTDAQRELGVQALWKAQARHIQKFRPNNYAIVWPIYPGSGYGWQDYGCRADKPSWWVKNRGKVAVAVGAVAAVALGPQIISAISGGGASATGAATGAAGAGTGAATTTGIVGAGAKAGALTTTVTAKAGAAAAITTKSVAAAGAVAGAANAGSLFSTTQKLVDTVNKARTVDAIIKGELPPPPINISGDNFTEWAMNVAKEELAKEGQKYLTQKQEEQLRRQIQEMQGELYPLAAGLPARPSPVLDPAVYTRLLQMQEIERKRDQQTMLYAALGAGALLLLAG